MLYVCRPHVKVIVTEDMPTDGHHTLTDDFYTHRARLHGRFRVGTQFSQ